MSAETPVVVRHRGHPIYGILHTPDRPRVPAAGISLLNPGLKSRVAPNRLNVLLARRLAEIGYHVLRIDPPGVGDSGGDLPEDPFPVLWQRVQRGEWVGAVRRVHEVFARECGLDEIVGMGNCGGAITALLEGQSNHLVRRLVLIDIPVTLQDADPEAALRIIGRQHGERVLVAYARRMLNMKAWWRLITFQSDRKRIVRAVRARFFDRGAQGGEPGEENGVDEGLSELFTGALKNFHERGGRALFLHAGENNDTYLYNELVDKTFMAPGTEMAERHQRVLIPGANHVYGTFEWRTALIEAVESWLEPGKAEDAP